MVEDGKIHSQEKTRSIPFKYGELRTKAETTLLLLTSMKVDDVIVNISKTPGELFRDAPIDANPDTIDSFPLEEVPPGHNFVVLVFPQNPDVYTNFWEIYKEQRQKFANDELDLTSK